jgi:hypothetical protein
MAMSHCFAEAFALCRQQKRPLPVIASLITEEEYIEHAVAHMRGVRHTADANEQDILVHASDPIGNTIRALSLAGYELTNSKISDHLKFEKR